ncbi:hypothetical protein [Haladaptatus sp. AB643]|uniref:hypothetical protein n=1 Tax=Haladaptatus sp. AB643 TaxID=2934174 RepID=UPI00209C2910|nr:hypothetical protein [Haladaptatus sp. AB643]MCO8245009.1 hypothetical protein [Haladaptatus sp. AB643]
MSLSCTDGRDSDKSSAHGDYVEENSNPDDFIRRSFFDWRADFSDWAEDTPDGGCFARQRFALARLRTQQRLQSW